MVVKSKSARAAGDKDASTPSRAPERGVNGGRRPSRREAMLQAAIDLFAKGGSRGTCIAAIADRIGVTPAAVIHHFKTKDALLTEVVAEIDNRRPKFEDLPEMSGSEHLRWIGSWGLLLEKDAEMANLSRLSTVMVAEALDPDHPSHAYFIERQREIKETVASVIRGGIADGWVRDDIDPEIVATLISATMQGAQLQWFLDPDSAPIQKVLKAMADLYIGALAPNEPSKRR